MFFVVTAVRNLDPACKKYDRRACESNDSIFFVLLYRTNKISINTSTTITIGFRYPEGTPTIISAMYTMIPAISILKRNESKIFGKDCKGQTFARRHTNA